MGRRGGKGSTGGFFGRNGMNCCVEGRERRGGRWGRALSSSFFSWLMAHGS